MNIGQYTFEDFKALVEKFHGYPAPGVLIGGCMVAKAQQLMPPDVLYQAVVETPKCLPDAIQLLAPLSLGNGRIAIADSGRYALSLYDKNTGEGWRVWLDHTKMERWPELKSWFLKLKPKHEQDTARLFAEMEDAGEQVLSWAAVRVKENYLYKKTEREIALCKQCGEAYQLPKQGARADGLCSACAGDSPYR